MCVKNADMNLKAYLKSTGKTSKDAADELGKHPIYFNTIVNGGKPGPRLTIDIEEWSGGAVSRHELRPDLWPDEKAV